MARKRPAGSSGKKDRAVGSAPRRNTGLLVTNAEIKAALRKTAGRIAAAARLLPGQPDPDTGEKRNMSRQSLHERVNNSAALKAFLYELDESILDAAESVVIEAIVKKKSEATSRWFLERKGKSRGFVLRNDAGNFRLPEDQLEQIVGSFGGDLDKLRALRSQLAAPA